MVAALGKAIHTIIVIRGYVRRCRAEGVLDTHTRWNRSKKRGWDVGIPSIDNRLRRRRCGAGAFVWWSKDRPPTVRFPMPDDRTWRRAMGRLRSWASLDILAAGGRSRLR